MAGSAGAEIYSRKDLSLTNWREFRSLYPDLRRAKDLLINEKMPFWGMNPDRSLVSAGYALAEPGETYLLYFPNGGSAHTLDLTAESGTFRVQWFNPRADDVLLDGTVTNLLGGSVVDLGAPPADTTSDWAVLVTR